MPPCNNNKPSLHHAVLLEYFFWKFQKIHEQLLLKAVKKLEALSETIRKIHDLKKASAG